MSIDWKKRLGLVRSTPAEVDTYSATDFQKFMQKDIEDRVKDIHDDLERALFSKDPEPLLFTGPVVGPDLSLKDLEESMALIKKVAADIETPIFVRAAPKFESLVPLPPMAPKKDVILTRLFGGPLKVEKPRSLRVDDVVITLKVRDAEPIVISEHFGVGLAESSLKLKVARSGRGYSVARKIHRDELPPPAKRSARKKPPSPVKAKPLAYGIDFPPPIKGDK